MGITAIVKVMLKDGTYHEDLGFGSAIDRNKGSAMEKAKKEAVSSPSYPFLSPLPFPFGLFTPSPLLC